MTEAQAAELIGLLKAALWLVGLVGLVGVFLLAVQAARGLIR